MLRRHIYIKNNLICFFKKEFHKLGVSSAVIDKLNNRVRKNYFLKLYLLLRFY